MMGIVKYFKKTSAPAKKAEQEELIGGDQNLEFWREDFIMSWAPEKEARRNSFIRDLDFLLAPLMKKEH